MEGEFKNVSTQNLECPVCLEMFTEPKILSCAHTFCNACLDHLIRCHGDDQKLICPICRRETEVPGQDVSQLQTNLALRALVDEVKTQHQCCTNCKSDEKPQAVVYCQDCGNYFCVSCQTKHSEWGGFSDHNVSTMSDVTSGKVTVRRYRKCKKYPKDDENWFCSECRIFVCFQCGVMGHKEKGHEIIEGSAYEENHNRNVEELRRQAHAKNKENKKYIDFIDEQKASVIKAKDNCITDIIRTYEESVRQLTKNKDKLINEVLTKTNKADAKLDKMKELAQQEITQVTTMADLLDSGTKIPLETDALAVHDNMCEDLKDALSRNDPDYEVVKMSSKEGNGIQFERIGRTSDLHLGNVLVNVDVKDISLPTRGSMNAIASTPDGRLAVGCYTGGIEIFSVNGQLHQTLLKDVAFQCLGFLSDGRCVALKMKNILSLYTTEWEKVNIEFETLSKDEGGISSLTVDSNDQIYVGYRKIKKIQVFSCTGGKAIKEIPCDRYTPEQIISHNDVFIIKCASTVITIDHEGKVKHKVTKSNTYPQPCLTSLNSILIAWVQYDDGLVSIDEYTSELEHVRNLITDYKIEKQEMRNWYFMREFRSGEIAFCTPDRLYIFKF